MDFDAANVLVAALAIVVSAALSWTAYRAAVHQNRLSASAVAADWLRDLRSWASEAVDVLAEVAYTCRKGDPEPNAEEKACVLRSRHRLSALVDRGRFLLPNEREGEYGEHKARAYKGLRHHALDYLVAADQVLGGDLPLLEFPDRKRALIGLRREFVSAIQSIIDPQSSNRQIAQMLRLANEERAMDPSLGGLLPDASKVPSGELGALRTASTRYASTKSVAQPRR